MKKLAVLMISTLGASSILAGLGASVASAKNAREQLTIAIQWTGAPAAAVQALLNKYNEENPTVHWNLVTDVSSEKLLTEEAADDAPSVAMLNTTNLVGSMAGDQAILALHKYIVQSKLNMNLFTRASLYSNSLLGQQYALPFFEDTYALYYNKALFKKAGIQSPPTTLQELAADAKKLTVTNRDGQFTQLGFTPSFENAKESEAYLYGGAWATSGGKVTATSPAAEKGVQWEVNLWREFGPDKVERFIAGSSGAAGNIDPFSVGKVGMEVSGEWFMPIIAQESPHMNYGVAPIPYPAGDAQYKNSGSVGGNPLVILKGAKNVPASWALIKWLATTGEVLGVKSAKLYSEIYAVPALKSLVNDPALAPTPQMAFFWKYSAGVHIHPFPPIPDATAYLEALSGAVQKAELGKLSVSTALQQVQTQYAPLVAQAIKQFRGA